MPAALFVTTVDITLEAFLLPFARHLREQRWRVDALAVGATGNPTLADSFDQRSDVSWSRNPLAPGNLLGAAGRVREVVEAGCYDLVWVHTPVAGWVTRYALRARGGIPVVYTAHGFHFYRGQGPLAHSLFRTMERVAAPWTADLVTVNDEDFAAAGLLGLPAERVHLVRGIGVDTGVFSPDAATDSTRARIRQDLRIPADAVVVTMIAEFNANKRHALALRALSRVRDPRVTLVLVGSGPLEASVLDAIRASGLDDRVVLTGYRRDIPDLLAASDLLLLCSEREGLNRSALEAMSSGVPVIGTPTRGIADAIGPDEAGWVATSSDPTALAAAIDAAAGSEAERARRAVAARERAVREFSLDRVMAAYDSIFASTLARTQGAMR
jgi:glycosyltransferase involved in cell wall biosynthesis